MPATRRRKAIKKEDLRVSILPERRCKVAKKYDWDVFCICRSSDSTGFMIGCDSCKEWYHGDCISVTKEDAANIKTFYCQKCEGQDKTLRTVYRFKNSSKKSKKSTQPIVRKCKHINCTQKARANSKYCSDKCGLETATKRLGYIMPLRLQELKVTALETRKKYKAEIHIITEKKIFLHESLQKLNEKRDKMDAIIQRAMETAVDPNYKQPNKPADDPQIYCVTCGINVHTSIAIKHMEKCFNKFELQTTFDSVLQTRKECKELICDHYIEENDTFCKRLRVICPEHCREPKFQDDVCGMPRNIKILELTEDYCRAPKKNCLLHYGWEKVHRAEIDLECIRCWSRLDELKRRETQLIAQISKRDNLLECIINNTFDHSTMEQYILLHKQKLTKATDDMNQAESSGDKDE